MNTYVTSLAISSSGDVFAGTWYGGVYRSTNNGSSWTLTSNGLPFANEPGYSLAINSSGEVFAGTNGGVYRSTDNGSRWTLANNGLINTSVTSSVDQFIGRYFYGN